MKHQFPKNKHVYCNEKHTLEQAEEFVFIAGLVGLKIHKDTLEDLVDDKFPYFMWDGSENIITQHSGGEAFDDDLVVSFEEFKKFLGPIPNTRLEIEKLFSTI